MIKILQGDCRNILKTLPDASVHCCVTSPPYFGLRAYLPGNHSLKQFEIGTEETPQAYVDTMVSVFREVRRVLRDDGTLWLNLGDSYASGECGRHDAVQKRRGADGKPFAKHGMQTKRNQIVLKTSLPTKNLLGIPWLVAFALQADGWYLRQDIIWHKPNPIPESVTDRCTKAHEYIFLLSKSARYYFDSKAISEKCVTEPGIMDRSKKGYNAALGDGSARFSSGARAYGIDGTRNKRSVWTVETTPYKGAHFATYPRKLIQPCVMAGCPGGGTVLDPFGGSGTTGAVASACGRDAILIELNPEYVKLGHKRGGLFIADEHGGDTE